MTPESHNSQMDPSPSHQTRLKLVRMKKLVMMEMMMSMMILILWLVSCLSFPMVWDQITPLKRVKKKKKKMKKMKMKS